MLYFESENELKFYNLEARPDKMSGLIWVQTVCKGYQQMTLVGKELSGFFELSEFE